MKRTWARSVNVNTSLPEAIEPVKGMAMSYRIGGDSYGGEVLSIEETFLSGRNKGLAKTVRILLFSEPELIERRWEQGRTVWVPKGKKTRDSRGSYVFGAREDYRDPSF